MVTEKDIINTFTHQNGYTRVLSKKLAYWRDNKQLFEKLISRGVLGYTRKGVNVTLTLISIPKLIKPNCEEKIRLYRIATHLRVAPDRYRDCCASSTIDNIKPVKTIIHGNSNSLRAKDQTSGSQAYYFSKPYWRRNY